MGKTIGKLALDAATRFNRYFFVVHPAAP